jgi:hypothetical protein
MSKRDNKIQRIKARAKRAKIKIKPVLKQHKAKTDTLCWYCKNTHADKCSWFQFPATPVKNWEAEHIKIYFRSEVPPRYEDSYKVHKCPGFELDSRYYDICDKHCFEKQYRKRV